VVGGQSVSSVAGLMLLTEQTPSPGVVNVVTSSDDLVGDHPTRYDEDVELITAAMTALPYRDPRTSRT